MINNNNNSKIIGPAANASNDQQDIELTDANINTLSYIAQRAEELEMDMNYSQAEEKIQQQEGA